MKLAVVLLVLSVCVANLCAHPIKMTTAKLVVFENKQAELTINFFLDDLEKQLIIESKNPTFKVQSSADARKRINDYILGRFSVLENGKRIGFIISDISYPEGNICQVKYRSSRNCDNKLSVIEISNRLLFEASEEQVNILHLETSGGKQIISFNYVDFDKKIIL